MTTTIPTDLLQRLINELKMAQEDKFSPTTDALIKEAEKEMRVRHYPLTHGECEKDWRVPGSWGWYEVMTCTGAWKVIFRMKDISEGFIFIDESWLYETPPHETLKRLDAKIPIGANAHANSIPATPEQIKKYLVEEAERRGYKLGKLLQNTGIRSHLSKNIIERQYDWSKEFEYYPERDMLSYWGCNIYEKGQWAEIVKEPQTVLDTIAPSEFWKGIPTELFPSFIPRALHADSLEKEPAPPAWPDDFNLQDVYRLKKDMVLPWETLPAGTCYTAEEWTGSESLKAIVPKLMLDTEWFEKVEPKPDHWEAIAVAIAHLDSVSGKLRALLKQDS